MIIIGGTGSYFVLFVFFVVVFSPVFQNFIISLPTEQVNLQRFESSACVRALLFGEPKAKNKINKNGTYNHIPCYTHTFGTVFFCVVFFSALFIYVSRLLYNPLMYLSVGMLLLNGHKIVNGWWRVCWRDAMRNDRALRLTHTQHNHEQVKCVSFFFKYYIFYVFGVIFWSLSAWNTGAKARTLTHTPNIKNVYSLSHNHFFHVYCDSSVALPYCILTQARLFNNRMRSLCRCLLLLLFRSSHH